MTLHTPMKRQLAPGVYVVGSQLQFDVPELLASLDLPDTEENRDMAVSTSTPARAAQEPGSTRGRGRSASSVNTRTARAVGLKTVR
jgi:hypothetical protein